MTVFSTLWAFVLLLSILVFVHELGHFLVARACGVRVLKFSIGFGPPIGFGRYRMIWNRGGTDFVVAWFPLGGFVKMLGENPDETDDPEVALHPGESLPEKSTWQKLAIVFAGPAANLVLPVAVFVATLAIGLPRPVAVIGNVEPRSPAEAAGLREGDRITAIAGQRVTWWREFEEALRERGGETVSLAYERDGVPSTTRLAIAHRATFDDFGQQVEVGWAGLDHRRPAPILGIASAESPSHAAGLRSGEIVEAVNGAPVETWSDFARAYAAAGIHGTVELTLRRGEAASDLSSRSEASRPARSEPKASEDRARVPSGDRTSGSAERRTVAVPALGSLDALGVLPANVLVAAVTPGSAAERGGLAPGDLIVSVDGAPVGSFNSFAEIVRTSGGRPLAIQYARDGELRAAEIAPALVDYDAGFGLKEPRYLVGISPHPATQTLPGELGLDRERNPLVSVPRAAGMTVDATRSFLQGLAKLVTGEVSRKQLAGPIGIAEIAGHAYRLGWESFVSLLVLISINLGILNLLPIPVLDGGQAMIYAVEGIRRAPLSMRTREIVQQFGLTVLLLLIGLAFWNDLSRQWTRLLDWLGSA